MTRGPRPAAPPRGGSARGRIPAAAPQRAPVGAAEPAPDLVLMGEFGRAHGLKGEVRLKSHTGDPRAIVEYNPLRGADGRVFELDFVRPAAGDQPDMLVARVVGVATREAAEALNRVGLYVPRERLAASTEEDEFLLADLVGLRAEDEAGAVLGVVTAVPNFGGGDLIEIAPNAGRETLLFPFTNAFVPLVDVAGGRIVVSPPDEAPDDDEPPPT